MTGQTNNTPIAMARYILLAALLLGTGAAHTAGAQEAPWTLEECIAHAQKHNIDVRQQALQAEESEVQLSTARGSRLPSLNASLGADASFGLSPSSNNVYVSSNRISGTAGVAASMPLFEGLGINRRIRSARLDLEAAVQELEQARENVAVQVMTLYLQVLLDRELVGVAERQLELSRRQVERNRQLVTSGRQPESALRESEALRAEDELSLTQARNDLTLALLDLSQALDRPSAAGFDVAVPTLDSLALEAMRDLGDPEAVWAYADAHRPAVRAGELRLESSENAVRAARSELYPSVSLTAGYSTGVYDHTGEAFWEQFRHNSREYVGLTVNIPIFNRRSARNGVRSAELSMRMQELALARTRQDLRKEIEQAYYNADAAWTRYLASERALASARVAFAYEEQKTEAGRSTLFDYYDARTRMQEAESTLVRAKYEFVFRSKILDFYRGRPIRL